MNHLYIADNMKVLRNAPDNKVDLIYLDPPFNSKRNYNLSFSGSIAQEKQFDDTWNWNARIHEEYEEIRKSGHDVYPYLKLLKNTDVGPYLTFMSSRLIEMHRVLKETGTIYLHCDPTMSHYLKQVMDLVFGRDHFRNEIVWCYTGPGNAKKDFSRKHDVILRYTKGDNWIFNVDKVRIPYKESTQKNLRRGYVVGGIFKQQNNKRLSTLAIIGKVPEDYWHIVSAGQGHESIGYPTQKPLKLLERIILASSNEGDLVLDPFCGSGTTLVAANNLKRNWVGIDCSHMSTVMLHARSPEAQFKLHGIPQDWASASQLAKDNPLEFKRWAVSELRSHLTGLSKVNVDDSKDLYYHLYYNACVADSEGHIIVRVVPTLKREHVDRMRADYQDLNVDGGILVSLRSIDRELIRIAEKAGVYKVPGGTFNRIQVCSVRDLFEGRIPKIPSTLTSSIFKKDNVVYIQRKPQLQLESKESQ